MFSHSQSKLEDARACLEGMVGARDTVKFKSAFNSFLSNCRAVTNALQKEGASVNDFSEWYQQKQDQMRADELLRFVHESRTEDFHEGRHKLRFGAYIKSLSGSAVGPPPKTGARFVVGAEGPFWLVDEGTPHAHRVPITQGTNHTISVSIDNPPQSHRGSTLAKNDPISICRCAHEYMAVLVHEAKTKFSQA